MSKSKAIRNRLEEIFSGSEPVSPEPLQPQAPPKDELQDYTYLDAAMILDRDLARVVEIGRALSQLNDLDTLVRQAAGMVCQQFGLYSVQIYMLEPSQALTLAAVAGVASRDISRRDRHHSMDSHSAVGIVLATGQPVIVHETRSSDIFTPDPLLPDTCCEFALPLRAAQRVFGVLDLYLAERYSYFSGRQTVFEVLACRIAAAIEKLVADTLKMGPRTTLAPDGTTRRLAHVRLGWDDFLDAIHRKDYVGYAYEDGENETIAELVKPLAASPGQMSLSVPLMLSGESIGSLDLERTSDGSIPSGAASWSKEESTLVHAIADRIARHLDNLRLLSQAERYRTEAEEAARRLTREGWENYMQSVTEAPAGFVYDLDEVKPLDDVEVLPLDEPEDDQPHHFSTQELRVRDETIGEVALADIAENDPVAASILSVVSDRLSTHIENLRLLEETERSRQQLDKRAAELETVARVSTAAATILSPQELLQSVVDLTKYSFNLYHVHVYMLSADKEALVLRAGAGKTGHRMVEEGEALPLLNGKSVVVRTALSRKGVIINDVREDPDFLTHPALPDALSELAVPMVVGDQLLGVFDVLASVTQRFTEDDMRTFTTLASQVSVALRNAELYAEQMAAVVRLRELDHLKNSFLANMSHELRTPLNSILGFAQVILEGLDGPLTDDMTNDLGLIEKNGNHLLSLINEILDMAKIEAGRMSLSPEPVNLADLLNDVIQTSGSLIRERNLYLALQNEENANITLLLDYTRMRQVFLNVIGNASKFTDQGGITVSVERYANKLHVLVQDTGIGIPPDKLEMIFEAFSQVDTSTTRKAGGTGLGLPISRRLVEMHGGRLWAESAGIPGEGSSFIVELPVNPVGKV
ncbi:MAG: ATP-binding protein [Chloroflexota bacterium]